MRKPALENNGERTLGQTVELDRAVAVAGRYAGPKSTIIVCGDVAIAGMNLNGFPFRKDSGIALLGLNSASEPRITWATGPTAQCLTARPKIPVSCQTSSRRNRWSQQRCTRNRRLSQSMMSLHLAAGLEPRRYKALRIAPSFSRSSGMSCSRGQAIAGVFTSSPRSACIWVFA